MKNTTTHSLSDNLQLNFTISRWLTASLYNSPPWASWNRHITTSAYLSSCAGPDRVLSATMSCDIASRALIPVTIQLSSPTVPPLFAGPSLMPWKCASASHEALPKPPRLPISISPSIPVVHAM
ncbi:hypothetical protein FOTG_10393 [Fusarium oxysporum f. sp. vasinfectum 25433]|nr:hypothetical protein FOTG_10393 [Fusarium oxysporum f. sp. vasinfectum 25433]EXM21784.1 hypothetical protein FOTG_10393 [Fusarium oxysporum f. sp. vasinfectum 25433]